DCLSTIVFILPLHLDYTKVIILILWWRNFQLEYWRTFQLVSTVQMHYREIINFFDRRSTNAASESFNAKIKEFRTQFRGVKDRAFFLFRLAKIYA
ncbi:transposase, partial [Bacteroides stercoris]|uniref:transposase n=1 Tax=Bacteroides stercoris TaxID=46506 RepID=UPI001E4C935A